MATSAPPPSPSSDHRRTWDAIPWLVADSAPADLRDLIAQHLPHCAECRAELAFQQRVRAGLHAGVPGTLPSPELGLQRLLARLDAAAEPTAAAAAAVAGRDPGDALVPQATPTPDTAPAAASPAARPHAAANWTRWLVAAVLVQAVGLGGAGLALFDRSRADRSPADGDRSDAGYRTLASPSAPAPVASVRLVPAPKLDFAALRQLLVQTRLVIVDSAPDGSSLGLAAVDGNPRTSTAALPLLRAQPGVLLAEPTGR